jgi:hypothetical protein
MEVKAGIRTATSAHKHHTAAGAPSSSSGAPDLSMQELIRAAHKLGFEVSFKPL